MDYEWDTIKAATNLKDKVHCTITPQRLTAIAIAHPQIVPR